MTQGPKFRVENVARVHLGSLDCFALVTGSVSVWEKVSFCKMFVLIGYSTLKEPISLGFIELLQGFRVSGLL